MANPASLNIAAAGADAVAGRLDGPQGPRPRARFSRRNIFICGTLGWSRCSTRCRCT